MKHRCTNFLKELIEEPYYIILKSASKIICRSISNCGQFPDKMVQQRVIMSFMGFLSIAVSYSMRACLSVAITEMTEPINNTNTGNQSMVCGILHSQTSHASKAMNTVSESIVPI